MQTSVEGQDLVRQTFVYLTYTHIVETFLIYIYVCGCVCVYVIKTRIILWKRRAVGHIVCTYFYNENSHANNIHRCILHTVHIYISCIEMCVCVCVIVVCRTTTIITQIIAIRTGGGNAAR